MLIQMWLVVAGEDGIRVDGGDLECMRKGSGRDKVRGIKRKGKVISNVMVAAFGLKTWLGKAGHEMPQSSHFQAQEVI